MNIDGIEYPDVKEVTEVRVLRSRRGFYHGREAITDWSHGGYVPFDRCSGYFDTPEEARNALEQRP